MIGKMVMSSTAQCNNLGTPLEPFDLHKLKPKGTFLAWGHQELLATKKDTPSEEHTFQFHHWASCILLNDAQEALINQPTTASPRFQGSLLQAMDFKDDKRQRKKTKESSSIPHAAPSSTFHPQKHHFPHKLHY